MLRDRAHLESVLERASAAGIDDLSSPAATSALGLELPPADVSVA